jgi:hypothetical protein
VLRYKGKDLARYTQNCYIMNWNRIVWNAAVPVPCRCRSHEHGHAMVRRLHADRSYETIDFCII